MQECLVVPRENTANQIFFWLEELSLDSHVPRKNTANLEVLRLEEFSLDGHVPRKKNSEVETLEAYEALPGWARPSQKTLRI